MASLCPREAGEQIKFLGQIFLLAKDPLVLADASDATERKTLSGPAPATPPNAHASEGNMPEHHLEIKARREILPPPFAGI